jgi:hypothetical protein
MPAKRLKNILQQFISGNKMNCREIKNLIYLKDAELKPEERESVAKHLESCPACAREYSEIMKSTLIIDKLKNTVPFLTNETEFTDSVMEQINNNSLSTNRSVIDNILGKISHFFMITSVRAAAVSVILILVTTFLVQQYLVFSSVSNLEAKLAVNNIPGQTTSQAGFNELKAVKLIADFYNLIKGERFYADLSKGMILADKGKLNEFLTLYSGLQNYKNLYSKEIEEKYPELNSFLSSKLSIEELQDFVKKNENLIKELSRKLPAGGK